MPYDVIACPFVPRDNLTYLSRHRETINNKRHSRSVMSSKRENVNITANFADLALFFLENEHLRRRGVILRFPCGRRLIATGAADKTER